MRIIPCPKEFTKKDGSFLFDAETGFSCDYENVGNSISSFLKTCGIGWRTGDDIKFTSDGSDSSSEAYTLVVGEDGVNVSAKSERGLFYGAQTLKQLTKRRKRRRFLVAKSTTSRVFRTADICSTPSDTFSRSKS